MNQLNYIKTLDGLRFYSILGVMLGHWVHSTFTYAFALGVIVFFVLSGYLITRILLVTKEKYPHEVPIRLFRTFYIRRSLRIFPIYFLTILILYFMNVPDIRLNIVWLLSFTANIQFFLNNSFYGFIGHLWSLSVEEQFYIFYPFLIFGLKRKFLLPSLVLMVSLGLISRAVLYFTGSGIVSQATFTFSAFDSLALGGILAYLELYNKTFLIKIITEYKNTWICILISFLLCYVFFSYGLNKLNNIFIAYNLIFSRLLISLLTFYFLANTILNRLGLNVRQYFENKYIVFLGKISYGMYFYHLFISASINYVIIKYQYIVINNQFLLFLIYFSATVLVSVLSWTLIEAPINNLKTKFKY
jgi:peptidoglycan/LPS O-acetylase OafA/YrhL